MKESDPACASGAFRLIKNVANQQIQRGLSWGPVFRDLDGVEAAAGDLGCRDLLA